MIDKPYEEWTPEDRTDNWLNQVFAIVLKCIECMGPVTWRAWPDCGKDTDPFAWDTTWFMEVYEELTELCEGEADGAHVYSGINVSISEIAYQLNALSSIDLYADPGETPPHVSLNCTHNFRNLSLSILTHPPSDAKVAMRSYKDGSMEAVYDDDDGDDDEE